MPAYEPGTQGIAIDGVPVYNTLKLKTVSTAHSKDGRLVVRNTDDSHVVIAGADAVNVLGYICPRGTHDVTADYAAEDEMSIGHGRGVVVTLTLITGQTITKGDHLAPAANGMLKAYSNTSPDPRLDIAVAESSVTTGTLASAPIVVRMLI